VRDSTLSFRSDWLFKNRIYRNVPGWFKVTDAKLFEILLQYQAEPHSILEVGVYQGKSAILLGYFSGPQSNFYVCDIFENNLSSRDNTIEIAKSYSNLSLKIFAENYLHFHKELPQILAIDSRELDNHFDGQKFEFIHLDGSHLFEAVKLDLAFARKSLNPDRGIIVMDDFRARHTPGVAAAMWEAISKFELKPLILSEEKAYLVDVNSKIDLKSLSKKLSDCKLDFEITNIANSEFIRLTNIENHFIYSRHPIIVRLCPPLVLSLAQSLLENFRVLRERKRR